jgi:hypothetical protein
MFRVFAAIAFLAQVSFASAGEYGTRDEAVAMVKTRRRHVRECGR